MASRQRHHSITAASRQRHGGVTAARPASLSPQLRPRLLGPASRLRHGQLDRQRHAAYLTSRAMPTASRRSHHGVIGRRHGRLDLSLSMTVTAQGHAPLLPPGRARRHRGPTQPNPTAAHRHGGVTGRDGCPIRRHVRPIRRHGRLIQYHGSHERHGGGTVASPPCNPASRPCNPSVTSVGSRRRVRAIQRHRGLGAASRRALRRRVTAG
jgi:hypothetical protein